MANEEKKAGKAIEVSRPARVLAPFEGCMPKVEVIDRDDAVVVRAEVPGVVIDDRVPSGLSIGWIRTERGLFQRLSMVCPMTARQDSPLSPGLWPVMCGVNTPDDILALPANIYQSGPLLIDIIANPYVEAYKSHNAVFAGSQIV